jgi:hypothetical protein
MRKTRRTYRAGLPLLGLFALMLVLSGCDSCGDFFHGQGTNTPLSCKGDGPKPQ